ncbi:hypothetical protein [Meridianimarinicoccus aquatilis]|uniref:Uncharacterized protein n=1 Tax=Meridianimarinicoccus aquatilis TaxID=2552766 RepID=A0A4R6AW98_9RHOB|nr:hypothetical protein [Fluviibacterium aquatile]QIE41696.1 hypothetical protein G5B39_06840 [Rhodobacteraceae bacterium SC52]TDL86293.1 hypothetical protein E2L05_13895 [Fluviibacterium aquatile]
MAKSDHQSDSSPSRAMIFLIAGGVAVAWAALFVLTLYPGSLSVPVILGGLLPLVLVAIGTSLALSLGELKAQALQLRVERKALSDALRQRSEHETPAPKPVKLPLATKPQVEQKAATTPTPARGQTSPQDSLPFDQGGDPVPQLTHPDLIRALHFPETPDDRDGLRALKKALEDHKMRLVVQAAQDMLTLLSQDGIYMDDLDHVRADPELWRRFARNDRDRAVAAVGGIHDQAALAKCRDRLQNNTVYRDTAHHFLRRFDQMLGTLVPDLTEDGVVALSETRSARAFMLVGRAAAVFGDDKS